MKKNINVLLFADDNYYKQLKTTIFSLLKNNKNTIFNFFIYGNISKSNKKKIDAFVSSHKSSVDFSLAFPDSFKSHFFVKDKTTIFLNKFIFFCLPDTIDRIIYIDCDLVVNGNICSFYYQDFNGKSVVVTKDLCLEWGPRMMPNEVLANDYFNAGVLLINLSAIKKRYSLLDIENYLNKYRGNLPCDDQDVLNMLLFNDKKVMNDRTYNYCIRHRDQSKNDEYKKCIIFHYYYQNNKPWKYSYYNRKGFMMYWKYAFRTYGYFSFFIHYLVFLYKITRHYYMGVLKNKLKAAFKRIVI